MKLYRKKIRAIAKELEDQGRTNTDTRYYPWYNEEDFPENMEELVKQENPFDGWYKYIVEETYTEVRDFEGHEIS